MSAATRRVMGSCGLFFHDRFRGRIGTQHFPFVTNVCLAVNVSGDRYFGRFQDATKAQIGVKPWKPSRDTSEQSHVTINQISLLSVMLFRIAAPL
ncbi:hypothetical protein [Aquicoccus sp. SU-CL01552]|uniref:hypothetical protein n=1 Tax=Aquicoccus sp. SU-CL01552 TaxID=3127656 RepID=UPI0033404201